MRDAFFCGRVVKTMYQRQLWQMRVPDAQGEYVPFVEDLMRMTSITVTMQLLMVFQGVATLDLGFVVYVLQMLVGVAAYWLVVRRAVGVAHY